MKNTQDNIQARCTAMGCEVGAPCRDAHTCRRLQIPDPSTIVSFSARLPSPSRRYPWAYDVFLDVSSTRDGGRGSSCHAKGSSSIRVQLQAELARTAPARTRFVAASQFLKPLTSRRDGHAKEVRCKKGWHVSLMTPPTEQNPTQALLQSPKLRRRASSLR